MIKFILLNNSKRETIKLLTKDSNLGPLRVKLPLTSLKFELKKITGLIFFCKWIKLNSVSLRIVFHFYTYWYLFSDINVYTTNILEAKANIKHYQNIWERRVDINVCTNIWTIYQKLKNVKLYQLLLSKCFKNVKFCPHSGARRGCWTARRISIKTDIGSFSKEKLQCHCRISISLTTAVTRHQKRR